MKAIAATLVAVIVILHPASAFAHAAPGGVTGFFGGFLHPLHVLPLHPFWSKIKVLNKIAESDDLAQPNDAVKFA